MAALCDRKARSEQPFGEVRIKRCLRARPKSEFTAEKVCSTGTNATGTNATGTNATGTNAAGTNAAETNAAETNAAGTHSAEMNATGTHSTGMHSAGTHSSERVAAFCCSAAFRRRSLRTPHFALRTPHSALRTSHFALRTKQPPAVSAAAAVKTAADGQSVQLAAHPHRCTCHKKHMREMFGLILLPK